ncbi:MAG: alpha/beta hydrolase [Deltaproteobacteria bacterium]|nr:MAG: alpha/beta hydrolase [Deltaproteobacteria bacterium]
MSKAVDEQRIFFTSNTIQIEGLIGLTSGDRGVVITHPHSLYGGSMHNNVVESLVRVYQRAGYSTLRFNFRGVGSSQGEYDGGLGEQQDVRSALQYLSGKGKTGIDLAGYSFGAWVNAMMGASGDTFERMIMVSPPVAFLEFPSVQLSPQLELVIAGSRDQIAPVEFIRTLLPAWNPRAVLHVIEGADHFYGGYTDELERIMEAYLKTEGD